MRYLRVKNWEKFQHYGSKREGPWIKLYTYVLDDHEFSTLPHESKGELLLIWLLAKRTENRFPDDPTWVQARIATDRPPNLQILIKKGFLVYDTMLAGDASTIREEKRREEKRRTWGFAACGGRGG